MITVSSPEKPFTYTAKGTTRRQTIIADYAQEIDALYTSAKEKASAEIQLPSSWDYEGILMFMRQLVYSVLNRHIQDDDDMFQYGCDRYVVSSPNALTNLLKATLSVCRLRGYVMRPST